MSKVKTKKLRKRETKSEMKAEDLYIINYRSKYNPCFKENRKIEQYTFDDMVEFAERYFEARTQAN